MPRFRIRYFDPVQEKEVEVVEEFNDTPAERAGRLHVRAVSAKEWAEDAAYTYADKHWHEVEEIA